MSVRRRWERRAVLGVAALIAILAHVNQIDALSSYRHGVILIIAFFSAAAIVAAEMLTSRSPGTAAMPTTTPVVEGAA